MVPPTQKNEPHEIPSVIYVWHSMASESALVLKEHEELTFDLFSKLQKHTYYKILWIISSVFTQFSTAKLIRGFFPLNDDFTHLLIIRSTYLPPTHFTSIIWNAYIIRPNSRVTDIKHTLKIHERFRFIFFAFLFIFTETINDIETSQTCCCANRNNNQTQKQVISKHHQIHKNYIDTRRGQQQQQQPTARRKCGKIVGDGQNVGPVSWLVVCVSIWCFLMIIGGCEFIWISNSPVKHILNQVKKKPHFLVESLNFPTVTTDIITQCAYNSKEQKKTIELSITFIVAIINASTLLYKIG